MGEALRADGPPDRLQPVPVRHGRRAAKWGAEVGGNLWRTTGDIRDRWHVDGRASASRQGSLAPFAGPGHWNDPDMLEVGNGGMTADEYRTHISLWSHARGAADRRQRPAHDVRRHEAILLNREVIAVDQDPLGRAAMRVWASDDLEVLAKPLEDGGYAVGLFNKGPADAEMSVKWSDLKRAAAPKGVRDLWAHVSIEPAADAFSTRVPAHGVALIRIQ